MNKIVKSILIGVGVLLSVVVILCITYYFKFNYETGKMKPLDTKEMTPGVFAIRDDFVNFYLVKDSDSYVAIDSGNNPKNVAGELKKLNIDPLQIKAVFLTHTHMDHIAGLRIFTNAKIYLSKDEKFNYKRLNPMNDGETVNIGSINIKCIFTPGHTTGSACYLVNGNLLFSGDNLSLKDGSAETFNNFFNSDTKRQITSLAKLKNLDTIKFVFTAHYGFSGDFKKAFEKIN
jgi:hydroxyacylglutathione hydrolase